MLGYFPVNLLTTSKKRLNHAGFSCYRYAKLRVNNP